MKGRMTCQTCGAGMTERRVTPAKPYRYELGGPENILLIGITVYECPQCGSVWPVIPRIEELHELISTLLLAKPGTLSGPELRFLRKHAGFPGKEFAELLGVTPTHLSRIENERSAVSRQLDKLGRVLVAASRDVNIKDVLLSVAKDLRSVKHATRTTPIFRLVKNRWELKRAA